MVEYEQKIGGLLFERNFLVTSACVKFLRDMSKTVERSGRSMWGWPSGLSNKKQDMQIDQTRTDDLCHATGRDNTGSADSIVAARRGLMECSTMP